MTWLQGLGRALLQLGRDAEACEALRLAIENNPNYPQLHALLAAALALHGRAEDAYAEMHLFDEAGLGDPVRALVRLASVPARATAPEYRRLSRRILLGMRRAIKT